MRTSPVKQLDASTATTTAEAPRRAPRRSWPLFTAVIVNLLIAAIASFCLTFFPLLDRSVSIASTSADEFGNALISNAYDQVERAVATCARGFEGIDSAGIQDLYHVDTPSLTKYWQLRARLAGDLTLWLAFQEGSGIFVGRNVPCDRSIERTANATTVWVTELHANQTFHAERWHMEGINTSLISGSRIGPIATEYSPLATEWYNDYVRSIYAHWRNPEVDTFGQFTAMRIGAQGGLNNAARYCAYVSEINSDAITTLLRAIRVSASGTMIVLHSATKALLGANFAFDSVVNESGTLRPRLYTEIGGESPLMAEIVAQFRDVIESCPDSCTLDVGVSFDKLFVRVRRIVDKSYGLDVRLVIGMRAIDFLDGIQNAQWFSLAVTLPTLMAVVGMLSLATWLTIYKASQFLNHGGGDGVGKETIATLTDRSSTLRLPGGDLR